MTDLNTDETLKPYIPGPEAKFKTVEELARAKAESDQFIERIKAENAEIRKTMGEYEANLQKAKGIDEVLDALKNMGTPVGRNSGNDELPSSEPSGERNQSNSPADEEHVRTLIDRMIAERSAASSAEANWNSFQDAYLKKHNGDNEEALVAMKYAAKEVGMTLEELKQLARLKPQAALRATGLSIPTPSHEPTRFAGKGSSDSGALGTQQSQDGPKPKSYYDGLRNQLKANGKASKFYSPEIQNRLHRDASQMGDAWFDA